MKKNLQSAFNQRQFMVKKDFEIYYYSDTCPLTIAPHTHPCYEFYFFLEGNASYTIKKTSYPLQFGDFLVVPPGIRHHASIRSSTHPYQRFVFWVSIDYMKQIAAAYPSLTFISQELACKKPVYLFHNDRIAFNHILRHIIPFLEDLHGNAYGRDDLITLDSISLMMSLCRVMHNQLCPKALSPEQDLYSKLLDYIENHLEESITLDQLAAIFFVSKYHIAHTFKAHMGLSVHQYILKQRLSAARNAILLNKPISKIYHLYGFNDYPGFFRAFKKEFGLSPHAYQKMAAASSIFDKNTNNRQHQEYRPLVADSPEKSC